MTYWDRKKTMKGDFPGHPFRGNQYVDADSWELGARLDADMTRVTLDTLREASKAIDKHLAASSRHYRATERFSYTDEKYQAHLAAAERHSEAANMYEKALSRLKSNKDRRVGLRLLEEAKERGKLASSFSGSARRGELGSWFGM